jgi:hypothetical protein
MTDNQFDKLSNADNWSKVLYLESKPLNKVSNTYYKVSLELFIYNIYKPYRITFKDDGVGSRWNMFNHRRKKLRLQIQVTFHKNKTS